MPSHFSLTLQDPLDSSPPGSSVRGILQARMLEWIAMPSSRGSSQPRDQTHVSASPALAGVLFTTSATWKARDNLQISLIHHILLGGAV